MGLAWLGSGCATGSRVVVSEPVIDRLQQHVREGEVAFVQCYRTTEERESYGKAILVVVDLWQVAIDFGEREQCWNQHPRQSGIA
jgi:hypothetical protein